MVDRQVVYNDLLKAFMDAQTAYTRKQSDIEVSKIWRELKQKKDFVQVVQEEIRKLTIDRFFNKAASKVQMKEKTDPPNTTQRTDLPVTIEISDSPVTNEIYHSKSKKVLQSIRNTPAQDKLKSDISNLTSDIVHLQNKKSRGIATDDELAELKKMIEVLNNKEKELKRKLSDSKRQQQARDTYKKKMEEIKRINPEIADQLRKRKKSARPRCEDQQPELLRVICDIATYGSSGADERRRTDGIRTIHTLDELTTELQARGYQLKRGAVYLRLLPRNSITAEGKRHVTTVPVRLQRATNDYHKQHADTKFCIAVIRYLEELASILGPEEVLFMSRDDKARVPIGKTAANKQTPLVMHLQYRIKLPDHDWIVAEKHKLIPSVNAFIRINPGMLVDIKAVTYSGPTFITIRSGKHSQSIAYAHAMDFDTAMECDDFAEFCKTKSGEYKPIVMITCDGGADENPRFVHLYYLSNFSRTKNFFKLLTFFQLFS